jgi:hypothetical protein
VQDYLETFAANAAAKRIHQVGISTAYLNSAAKQICASLSAKMVKDSFASSNGLQQAGSEWRHTISSVLISFGLKPEPCLFELRSGDVIMLHGRKRACSNRDRRHGQALSKPERCKTR